MNPTITCSILLLVTVTGVGAWSCTWEPGADSAITQEWTLLSSRDEWGSLRNPSAYSPSSPAYVGYGPDRREDPYNHQLRASVIVSCYGVSLQFYGSYPRSVSDPDIILDKVGYDLRVRLNGAMEETWAAQRASSEDFASSVLDFENTDHVITRLQQARSLQLLMPLSDAAMPVRFDWSLAGSAAAIQVVLASCSE